MYETLSICDSTKHKDIDYISQHHYVYKPDGIGWIHITCKDYKVGQLIAELICRFCNKPSDKSPLAILRDNYEFIEIYDYVIESTDGITIEIRLENKLGYESEVIEDVLLNLFMKIKNEVC